MSPRLRTAGLLALAACAGLAGCGSIGGAAGAVAGMTSGTFTANPAVGYAVGVSVKAATDATVKYVLREWKRDQQNAMANVAGQLPIGQVQRWEIQHPVPYDNERGNLQVVRDIDTPLARCREILFTVDGDTPKAGYVATICQQQRQWRWASAEPAVDRWGSLQ